MSPARVLLCLFLLLPATHSASAQGEKPPKFDAPVVMGDYLLFGDSEWGSKKVTCVNLKDGSKVWEQQDTGQDFCPFFFRDGQVWYTRKGGVHRGLPQTAKTTPVFQDNIDGGYLAESGPDHAYLCAYRGDDDILVMLSLKSGHKLWEQPGVIEVLDGKTDLLICHVGKRESALGQEFFKEHKLAAFDRATGKERWSIPLPTGSKYGQAGIVGDYVVFDTLRGEVAFAERETGKIVKRERVSKSQLNPDFLIIPGDKHAYVWAALPDPATHTVKPKVFAFDPAKDFARTLLLEPEFAADYYDFLDGVLIGANDDRIIAYDVATKKKLWEEGEFFWDHAADGVINYSTREPDGRRALKQVNVKTGKKKTLYVEP